MKTAIKRMSISFSSLPKLHQLFYVFLLVLVLTLMVNYGQAYNRQREGFAVGDGEVGTIRQDKFTNKTGDDIYDEFYVNVYDSLLFSRNKNEFEVAEVIKETSPSKKNSVFLDIGSGSGHHVKSLSANGFKVIGIDKSKAMVNQAKITYPDMDYRVADALESMTFSPASFTHITCLYFTIYYIKQKEKFFENCMQWLTPGGFLVLHLVDRENFDPILPAGDPFGIISPQKYAKKRLTSTVVKFDKYDYKSNFEIFPNDDTAIMREVFKDRMNGQVRQNEHKFYMPTQKEILNQAKSAGFILHSQVEMTKCQYSHQYLYMLQKPS